MSVTAQVLEIHLQAKESVWLHKAWMTSDKVNPWGLLEEEKLMGGVVNASTGQSRKV